MRTLRSGGGAPAKLLGDCKGGGSGGGGGGCGGREDAAGCREGGRNEMKKPQREGSLSSKNNVVFLT